jgi:hypothetical protein
MAGIPLMKYDQEHETLAGDNDHIKYDSTRVIVLLALYPFFSGIHAHT